MVPHYWIEFITQNELIGEEIEFPWPGESDLNAIVEILSLKSILLEATELWPGTAVVQHGFIPVGACSIGAGDQFFINSNDGASGPLYKIDHEQVKVGGLLPDGAVLKMLQHYEELLDWHSKLRDV